MSERWLKESEMVLENLLRLLDMEGKDRLDLAKSIRFALYALNRSVSGWLWWINNPDIMVSFSLEEFKEINKTILELTKAFIEYDLKITKQGIEKGTKRKHETPVMVEEDFPSELEGDYVV